MENKTIACKIIEINSDKIICKSYSGAIIEVYYEDLSYYIDQKSFSLNQEVLLKKKNNYYVIVEKPTQYDKRKMLLEVRQRHKKMMSSLNFALLEENLNVQVKTELKRMKGEWHDKTRKIWTTSRNWA